MKKIINALLILAVITCFTGCISLEGMLSSFVNDSVDEAADQAYASTYSGGGSSEEDQALFLAAEGGNSCKNLTDSDVKNYYSNRYFISEISDSYYHGNWTAQQLLDSYESQLESLGISGPNRYAKLRMIEKCDTILTTEYSIRNNENAMQQYRNAGIDPDEMIETMLADKKAEVNDKDFAVVKRNWTN